MQNKINFFLFFLLSIAAFSQKEKLIQGKINVKGSKLDGVRVVNLVNEKETFTDADGRFSILVKPDDLLIFSAEFLDYMRKIVEESDYKEGKISIEMTSKIIQLDEVEIIDYSRINAVSLGILARPPKQYTPAERRYRTATENYFSWNTDGTTGFSAILDGYLNLLSGRKKMLEKALHVEQKQILLEKVDNYYNDAFLKEKLQIESLYLGRFKIYAVYDAAFVDAIQSKHKARMDFNLYRLAIEFKKINENDTANKK